MVVNGAEKILPEHEKQVVEYRKNYLKMRKNACKSFYTSRKGCFMSYFIFN